MTIIHWYERGKRRQRMFQRKYGSKGAERFIARLEDEKALYWCEDRGE